MDYPTLTDSCGNEVKPSVALTEKSIKSTIKGQESEAGYSITRPRFTRNKRSFKIFYNNVENSIYEQLVDFYENSAVGGAYNFNFTHPLTGVVYDVRFAEDTLIRELTPDINRSSFNFVLLEV